MALVTHQMQGSYTTFPLRPFSWTKGFKLKQHVSTLHMFGRIDRRISVKRNLRLSVGACVHGPRTNFFKISAFKGTAQNDESRNRANGSKISHKSVKLSYAQKESGETIMESPKVHSVPVSYTSEANEGFNGSPAIHKLFKKWLNMLRTQSPNQVADEILGEGIPSSEGSEQTQTAAQTKESGEILKTVWSHFLGLDTTIKIPLMVLQWYSFPHGAKEKRKKRESWQLVGIITGTKEKNDCKKGFRDKGIPLYLAVNVVYGVEVSKELTPLWILGPLIVALYIKMLRVLWALYVFSFRQTVKLVKNLPTYYLVASSYITRGRLKEDVHARVVQPVINIKNLDYKELSRKKLKEFEEWLLDKYFDYVESIWPYYCRTIRFLKRANLI